MKRILLTLLMLSLALPAFAAKELPGKGSHGQARTRNLEYRFFPGSPGKCRLEELGYDVKEPKELQNPLFYKSLALGDVDYWTNGWFPDHEGPDAEKLLR